MKSMSNRLFLTFMLSLGTILAVLMIVIGQLFPVYVEQYKEQASSSSQEAIEKVLEERHITLSEEDKKH